MKKESKILIFRLLAVSIFAGVMGFSANTSNYILAIISFIILVIISVIINKKFYKTIEDNGSVVVDERDYKISGKASFWAIRIYAIPAAAISFILVVAREVPFIKNNNLFIVGETLSYSVCILLIIYSIVFRILRKKGE